MKVLLVHQAYPGQFVHLARALNARGDDVTVICHERSSRGLHGVARVAAYRHHHGNTPGLSPLLQDLETKLLRGTWAGEQAETLRVAGYVPDLIIAHPGWGEALFLRDIWPTIPQLHYLEFDYQSGVDLHFDPEFSSASTWIDRARHRMKTANSRLNLDAMTWGVTPTRFQQSTLPVEYHSRISVIHDGIDTRRLKPQPSSQLVLANGTVLGGPGASPVITMVNRTFEPYRGIHRFMRAIPALQRLHPSLQILLIGRDTSDVSYGRKRQDGRGWLSALRDELDRQIDWTRVYCPGALPYPQFVRALQLTTAHIYFTYPFVLSWSLLEAMSCGALVIGSDTAPVRELIVDEDNGLLVDFFDEDALVAAVSRALSSGDSDITRMKIAARKTIQEHYQLENCLRRQLALIDALSMDVIGATP